MKAATGVVVVILALLGHIAGGPSEDTHAASGEYRRAYFGPAWKDVDGNGCNTRQDILARDLTNVRRDGCKVLSGVLPVDPYTGQRISYRSTDPTRVQIDHTVALSDAWKSGADEWSDAKRVAFANDPRNLVAVDGPTNQSKSDKGPDVWSPVNRAYACQYGTRYLRVKKIYHLQVTTSQRAAVRSACGKVNR